MQIYQTEIRYILKPTDYRIFRMMFDMRLSLLGTWALEEGNAYRFFMRPLAD